MGQAKKAFEQIKRLRASRRKSMGLAAIAAANAVQNKESALHNLSQVLASVGINLDTLMAQVQAMSSEERQEFLRPQDESDQHMA